MYLHYVQLIDVIVQNEAKLSNDIKVNFFIDEKGQGVRGVRLRKGRTEEALNASGFLPRERR